jgi:hypothetical protein
MRISAALLFATAAALALPVALPAQSPSDAAPVDPLHRSFDELLDLNVRDGLVYYNALKYEHRRLDSYVASLDSAAISNALPKWNREQQAAFWLNAYNAFALQTVVSHYPIRGGAKQYPTGSIRQIPGAFGALPAPRGRPRRHAGSDRETIVAEFRDPRMFLAL